MSYPDAPTERLRNATRKAFENLVQIAIDEAVAFVIIAGDLFDGQWKDMNTDICSFSLAFRTKSSLRFATSPMSGTTKSGSKKSNSTRHHRWTLTSFVRETIYLENFCVTFRTPLQTRTN